MEAPLTFKREFSARVANQVAFPLLQHLLYNAIQALGSAASTLHVEWHLTSYLVVAIQDNPHPRKLIDTLTKMC